MVPALLTSICKKEEIKERKINIYLAPGTIHQKTKHKKFKQIHYPLIQHFFI